MSSEPSNPPKSHRSRLWAAAPLLFVAGAAMLPACPGNLADPQDFSGVPADIIGPRCAISGCHDSITLSGGLNLTPDANLTKRIVNVSSPPSQICTGKFIDTTTPEASLIYAKCTSTPPCGVQMPNNGSQLSATELMDLLTWVQGLK